MTDQEGAQKGGLSRRDFLKLMGAAGTGLAFAPFVPWGNFMPNPSSTSLERVPVELPDGTHANVATFPTNHAEVITYPKTGDRVLDEEAFRKWQFIRLPEGLGGDKQDVSSFRAYSMICLHLWCLWKYWQDGRQRGECPCHGSIYDPLTGNTAIPYQLHYYLRPKSEAISTNCHPESCSKSSFGSVLDGAACSDAGPAIAVPVRGSYMLP